MICNAIKIIHNDVIEVIHNAQIVLQFDEWISSSSLRKFSEINNRRKL